jgi:lipopolysaccharide export system permease protein
MRLLDRYLFRELLLPLAYCVGGFLICFVVFDLFKEISDFQRNKLTGLDILEYYSNRVPELMVTSYIMPMGLLLALLYALTNHARHHELTAMRAAGISLWRLAVPYFLVGVLFSIAVFVLNEEVVPNAAEQSERIMWRRTKAGAAKMPDKKVWQRNVLFLNSVDNRAWQIGAYNLQTRRMYNIHLELRSPNGARTNIFAERGSYFRRQWTLTNVQQFVYATPTTEFPVKYVQPLLTLPRIIETPRLIQSEIKISGLDDLKSLRKTQLSSLSILDYLRLHPSLDEQKRDSLLTMLHSRLAAPWTCLVVVLIAIPFGALPGRRNVMVGVASSISICFVYFVAKDLTLALGSGGFVPPWVAAWIPNLFFAAAGMVLMWRLR